MTEGLRTALARLRHCTPAGGSLPNTPNPPSTPEHKSQGCSRNRESATRCGSLGSNACDQGDTSQSQPSRGQHGADSGSGGGGGGRDGDLLSSAIRRFNFKSAGGSRSCRTVPKVVVMGSSTASETTINTSTDSANTMLTMVTTTDGEQPDDSFDLIDVPAEMSPPATAPSQSPIHLVGHSDDMATGSRNSSPASPTSPISVAAPASQTTPPLPLPSSPTSSLCAFDGPEVAGPSSRCSRSKLDSDRPSDGNPKAISATIGQGHASNCAEGTSALPPPTPMIGAHQETRFTFGGSGRTPPLPDLRAADFFSTPVRGSVDAGQPDSIDTRSSIRNLVAVQEKQNRMAYQIDYMTGGKVNSIQANPLEKGIADHRRSQKRPNINVTTNPLDISLIGATQPCNTQGCNVQGGTSTKSRGRSAGGSAGGAGKRSTQATIVVQQPSLSLDAPAATILLHPDADVRRREENMRQLLDVANTLTLQEIHDFEMRYGSPHHSRSQSVKAPGSRSSGRPNYLCLPQQRSRVASMPNTGVEEEYYRLRHFSITGKGVVNRGDSLKSRRSRSNNSVASSNSSLSSIRRSTEHLTASYPGSARNSAAGSLASSRESSASQGPAPYRVLMLGAPAVGKSSLVSQFMTSEYLHAYDTSIDDESGEKTVSVLLAGEESELTFIDHSCAEMTAENCIATYEPHAYCVVYSTTDRASVRVAEEVLQSLWRSDHMSARAVILVGNKVDLVRSRLVSTEEGKSMATSYDCKFIETSVGINHNVDELLVGLLTQIRLKLENPERTREMFRKRSRKNRSKSPLGSCSENNSPKKYRGSRTSTSLKVRNLLDKVWARDSKSKSCENLHVL